MSASGSKAPVQGCPAPVRHSPQYPSKQTIQAETSLAVECHNRTLAAQQKVGAAVIEWINHRNAHPKPFVWTATAKSIILKRHRAKKTLANLALGCK
jgi:hypothetical protein